jgi:hypothetical protein
MKKKNKKIKISKIGEDFAMQPILFTREQYKELLRAFGAYALVKQSSILPDSETARLFDYIIGQGKKFEFEIKKLSDWQWFEEINDQVFNDLFEYTQEEMWEHLANLFARRDVVAEIEEKTGLSEAELPPDMFLDSMAKRIVLYLKEFQKNGINNLECSNVKKNLLKVKEIKKK